MKLPAILLSLFAATSFGFAATQHTTLESTNSDRLEQCFDKDCGKKKCGDKKECSEKKECDKEKKKDCGCSEKCDKAEKKEA